MESLRESIAVGNHEQFVALIEAKADSLYQEKHGYNAIINALKGQENSRLIEMLTLLVGSSVSLLERDYYYYGALAVYILSRIGSFDSVQLLLEAGANPDDITRAELMEAVEFGSLADVQESIGRGLDLEGRNYWEQTAWLIAIETGDISKAKFLLDHGANVDARGRCGQPPLFYAVESRHSSMLKWLLEVGADIHQTDDFGETALITATGYDNLEAVEMLLEAGANVHAEANNASALNHASNRIIAMRLLEAGADPQQLSFEGRSAILGYSPEPDANLLSVSVEEFQRFRSRRFGTKNPEKMNNPFWEGMIRSGMNAYQAVVKVEGKRNYAERNNPIWCADRFGQSLTFLKDGRIVQVAGEHEDGCDPDFCIYNDVFVHDADRNITIYGYPDALFPPTDFHTATLIGNHIYLIGSLGYSGTRRFGETPVYRLNVDTFEIECLNTSGSNPGWIYMHRAVQSTAHEIQITGGKVATTTDGVEKHDDNVITFTLNIESLIWSVNDPMLP
jgi:hypothetical protein